MSKRIFRVLLVLFISIGLASTALAQRQTGSINGVVKDTEGMVLPGATVTVSGEKLMGDFSYVTTDTGTFRFPAVPPGVYDVKAELAGFKTLTQEGIVVRVGHATTLDIVLELTTIEESVTVVGLTPTVDVSSTKVSVSYTADLVGNIPMGRDLYDLIASAPGVVSENVTYRRTASTHGSSVRGNQYAFDGFLMNDPVVSYLATNINFDAFDEVEMELSGHPAEVGQTDGAYINIVTKSGGNEFHGLAQVYYTSEDMVSTNFTDHQLQTFRSLSPIAPSGESTVSPPKTLTDFDASFQIGGPLIKDKLWFFASGRYFKWTRHYAGFVDPVTSDAVDVDHTEWNAQVKLTFQPSSAHRITANYYRTNLTEPYMTLDVSPYALPEACAKWDGEYSNVIYGKWNWVIDQNTFTDLRVGYINRYFPEFLQDELGPPASLIPNAIYGNPHLDLGTGFYYGTSRFGEIYNRGRWEFLGSLTRFVDNFLGGNHEIKLGVEHERARGTWETWLPEEPGARFLTVDYDYMGYGGDFCYVSAFAIGQEHGQSDELNRMNRWSAYLQDSFTIADKLTINAGVRWDWSEGIIPEQTNVGNPFWQNILDNADVTWYTNPQPLYFAPKEYPEYRDYMTWNTLSPRVGITYDPFGDGRTALRASYSHYVEMMMLQFTSLPNPNYIHTGDFYWYDLDGNNWPDVTDKYSFVWLSREEDPATGLPDLSKEVDPDLTPPYVDEVTVGIERELFPDLSLGVTFIRKWERNMIESFVRPDANVTWTESSWSEPGPDEEWNTGDDISFPVFLGSGVVPTWTTNINGEDGKPTAKRDYQAVEFIINKRMSNRWQFFGSVVLSKAEGNIGQSYGASYGGSGAYTNPNSYHNQYGRLNMERPVVIKLSGTYQAPLDFNISFYFTHYSGYPYERQVRVYYLDPWASYRYVTTQISGEYREPSRDNLDLRVEKTFNIGPGKLGLFLDIFNVLNSGYVNYYHGYAGRVYYDQPGRWASNGRFLNEISSLTAPRVFKISARFSF
jgi:hypothetical protein